jgi:hypothetical protein
MSRRAAPRAAHRRLLRFAQARRRLLRLCHVSGCLGTSRGLSRVSSSTTSLRAGSSSTTSPPPRIRVPQHITRLVVRLIVDYFASRRLVIDYFAYATRPRASARRAARQTACRRLLRLEQARHRQLRLLRASGCLGTSRGSSSTTLPRAGSSSTTSPPPRVRVPRHVARLVTRIIVDYFASRRLVVDYFAYAARLGASARRAARQAAHRRLLRLEQALVDYFASAARPSASARRAARRRLLCLAQARRRLLRLRRASRCLGTSRGSLSTTSTTPRVRVPRHVARLVTWLVTPLLVDYSASRRLVVDHFAYAARPDVLARGSSRGSSSTTSLRAGSSSTTSPMPRVRVPRHVARLAAHLIVYYFASRRLVVDYFASAAHPGASAHRATRRATHRRLLRFAQARHRLLRLRHASGCLGTSRGSSSGSSSTTSP